MTFWFCKITQQRSKFALTISNAEAFLCFQYLPWQKKCRSDSILSNYKNYFSKKKKKYTFVQERKEMLHSIKKLFLFSLQFYKLLSTDVCIIFSFFFSLILVFNKRVIERILILSYSYKLQKIKKMKERKNLPHQIVAAEYVAEQIISLILQLDLRRFYCLMFTPSRKLQYSVV